MEGNSTPEEEKFEVEITSDDEQPESSDNNIESTEKQLELSVEELDDLLKQEKQKVTDYEQKLKHTLADFQNLERKTKTDIENGVNLLIDEFMIDFLQIYDDFVRAKQVFSESKINTDGLNSILKNMDSLLSKYKITSIDALGEIFDPKLHEAISITEDSTLDDDTITKEIRKGYISHNRVIRPALVEISKKSKLEQSSE
jgi:molecular chaperone GrpE